MGVRNENDIIDILTLVDSVSLIHKAEKTLMVLKVVMYLIAYNINDGLMSVSIELDTGHRKSPQQKSDQVIGSGLQKGRQIGEEPHEDSSMSLMCRAVRFFVYAHRKL